MRGWSNKGVAAVIAIACASWVGAASAAVEGAGATFPSQVYARWAQKFEAASGIPVRYRPTGSGDGLTQVTSRAVHFGGSDSPLQADELRQRRLVQVPMLVGGIVPVVNLPGVGDKRLQLTGDLLADLMSGQVRQWNDPRIAALNPGLALPPLPVRRLVRADKSGTTEGFSRYLAAASPAFARDVGMGQLPKWPADAERVEGNDGMVRRLKAMPGALAYVSFDRAERDALATVQLRNVAGAWVAASVAGFRSAVIESDLSKQGDDRASLMNRPGAASWPITMTTFVLFDAAPPTAMQASDSLRFLYWCLQNGDELTRGTGFAPLPTTLQSRLAARFMAVRPQDGRSPDYLPR